jgi:hypothetical protein
MKRVAKMLRAHRAFLLNLVQGEGRDGTRRRRGLNSNAKLAIRKARGFRTYEALDIAFYHQLGHLPSPKSPTDFPEEPILEERQTCAWAARGIDTAHVALCVTLQAN